MSPDDPFFPDDKLEHGTAAEPAWVAITLRLLPVPIFAFAAMVATALASIFCLIYSSTEESPIGWALCGGFALLAVLIGAASLYRHLYRRSHDATQLPRYAESEERPTGAIVVLLVSIYSWMLTVGIHVFGRFFAVNRPGGLKYDVTVGIAIVTSIYMAIYGRRLIREWFGNRGGNNIVVTPGQALIVVLVVIACGSYFAWLMV